MCVYALSLQPLICCLEVVIQAKQCWFPDDATRCGSLQNISAWWDELTLAGPEDLGYYPNAGKYRLVTNSKHARSIFEETAI